ncbi:death domain-containing protein 1 [Antennarius striatus]|uniref:death domain-containing protein 1 n=1 Tax=Antennarius striatus TaxID=241820 RepID=UPI0035AE3BBF
MDENLHQTERTDELKSLDGRRKEDSLLITLAETIRGLEAVRHDRRHQDGAGRKHSGEGPGGCEGMETPGGGEEGMLSPAEREKKDDERGGSVEDECKEKGYKQEVLRVLRELGLLHSDRLMAWREAFGKCSRMLGVSPAGGENEQHPSTTDTVCEATPGSDFSDALLSVEEDVQNMIETLNKIISKMEEEILKLCKEEEVSTQETRYPKAAEHYGNDDLSANDPVQYESEQGVDQTQTMLSPDAEQTSASRFNTSELDEVEETGQEPVVSGPGSNEEDLVSYQHETDLCEETNENVKTKEETNEEWITVGLTGHQEDEHSGSPPACLIRAPPGMADALRCDTVDSLSFLMVSGSEELVSRVIRIAAQDGAAVHFPVTVVVPFCMHYRGNYRDIVVKIVDEEGRSSYVTPVTTEGMHKGQRGPSAEVRVYSFGLLAVVLCLKRENYTIPIRGLSLKLPMDPRICLNYLPGSFTAPVMAQTMIQPVDAGTLASVKSRSDSYHSVASTSPLLYLSHPTSQPLKRPLTLVLPCPPNPEKKRQTRGRGEAQDHQVGPPWDRPVSARRGILVGSVKNKEVSDEVLIALGWRDKLWSVLEDVTVRSQKKGLVSLELTEIFDRLLVVRLLSPPESCHLVSLAEALGESICHHAVTVVLQRRPDRPHVVLVAALPSRDLGWELSKLRAQGHSGLLQTSTEISMCEGDQLVLRFGGNITSTGIQNYPKAITFHNQQTNHLLVHLKEVDPFGNYSSPHYKGTLTFHKVTRDQLERRVDRQEPPDAKFLENPVCKLPLTLPKKARTINRPALTRVKLCEETDFLSDSLLLWLSEQLSEEEVSLLVLSLRLRRSAAQLAKLRSGNNPSTHAFHALAMWRRGLPASTHQPKASQLAHCLAKSGRPDLAGELLVRQALAARQDPKTKEL